MFARLTDVIEGIIAIRDGRLVTAEREEVHARGWLHFGVHLVACCGSEIFLQRRSTHLASNPGRWTNVVSGHIVEGDLAPVDELTLTDAAARSALNREAREELGYWLPIRRATRIGHVLVSNPTAGGTCSCIALIYTMQTPPLVLAEVGEAEDVCGVNLCAVFAAVARNVPLTLRGDMPADLSSDFLPVMRHFFRRKRRRELKPGANDES